jgi:DNA mismatch repair ATPase MutS
VTILVLQVVRRKVVSVLTKGTIVEADMLASHLEASYPLAVSELAPTGTQAAGLINGSAVIGVCAVDTAARYDH